jgi:hypothetical protein
MAGAGGSSRVHPAFRANIRHEPILCQIFLIETVVAHFVENNVPMQALRTQRVQHSLRFS